MVEEELKKAILEIAKDKIYKEIGGDCGEIEIYDVKIDFHARRIDVDDRGPDLDDEFKIEVK